MMSGSALLLRILFVTGVPFVGGKRTVSRMVKRDVSEDIVQGAVKPTEVAGDAEEKPSSEMVRVNAHRPTVSFADGKWGRVTPRQKAKWDMEAKLKSALGLDLVPNVIYLARDPAPLTKAVMKAKALIEPHSEELATDLLLILRDLSIKSGEIPANLDHPEVPVLPAELGHGSTNLGPSIQARLEDLKDSVMELPSIKALLETEAGKELFEAGKDVQEAFIKYKQHKMPRDDANWPFNSVHLEKYHGRVDVGGMGTYPGFLDVNIDDFGNSINDLVISDARSLRPTFEEDSVTFLVATKLPMVIISDEDEAWEADDPAAIKKLRKAVLRKVLEEAVAVTVDLSEYPEEAEAVEEDPHSGVRYEGISINFNDNGKDHPSYPNKQFPEAQLTGEEIEEIAADLRLHARKDYGDQWRKFTICSRPELCCWPEPCTIEQSKEDREMQADAEEARRAMQKQLMGGNPFANVQLKKPKAVKPEA